MERRIVILRFSVGAVIVLRGILVLACYQLALHQRLATEKLSATASSTDGTYTYVNATEDDIFIASPAPDTSTTHTIIATGFARGPWYFEAVFPVEVKDKNGVVIGTGQGKAQGDWMTTSFVRFIAEVDLKGPYNGMATVVLKKDNPSGIAAKDASVSFPVMVQ